jgi:2-amino-4-hydroxy-6-hydroxymethyldihydropteridine diphosphokinase
MMDGPYMINGKPRRIDMGFIQPPPGNTGYRDGNRMGREGIRDYMAYITELTQKYPDRFIGNFTYNPRWGPENGAAELDTELPPRELLGRLLEIERRLGRVRGAGPRFGPRTIDLDLLLVDGVILDEPGLTLPHPRLLERRFVLEPLAELDPALEIPGGGPVQAVLAGL